MFVCEEGWVFVFLVLFVVGRYVCYVDYCED